MRSYHIRLNETPMSPPPFPPYSHCLSHSHSHTHSHSRSLSLSRFHARNMLCWHVCLCLCVCVFVYRTLCSHFYHMLNISRRLYNALFFIRLLKAIIIRFPFVSRTEKIIQNKLFLENGFIFFLSYVKIETNACRVIVIVIVVILFCYCYCCISKLGSFLLKFMHLPGCCCRCCFC